VKRLLPWSQSRLSVGLAVCFAVLAGIVALDGDLDWVFFALVAVTASWLVVAWREHGRATG
jgi:hypothetical protein